MPTLSHNQPIAQRIAMLKLEGGRARNPRNIVLGRQKVEVACLYSLLLAIAVQVSRQTVRSTSTFKA